MPWVQSAGPSTEDSGPAPSMIRWLRRNQATSSPTRASMASMNHDRPWPACGVRTGNRVGSSASPCVSTDPGNPTARSRDSVTRTVAQGCASLSGHSVLSTTLTRPPSVRTASWVRKLAIGVGRRNHAVAETAVPHFRSSARTSTSAVSRLATAPPCSPANGPAARAEGCQQFGAASGSKIAKAISSGEKYWVLVQMNDKNRHNKGYFIT